MGAKTTDRRLQTLSRKLSGASAASSSSMEGSIDDGMPEPVVTIVIDTPHGRVGSLPISESAAASVRESIETGIERLQQLRLDTESGTALIPGNLLRQSLIRNRVACSRFRRTWLIHGKCPRIIALTGA